MRVWSAENPHEMVETCLYPIRIGVWCALSWRRSIGPVVFDDTNNIERYRNLIMESFINQLHADRKVCGRYRTF
jgi:hypothetical protein